MYTAYEAALYRLHVSITISCMLMSVLVHCHLLMLVHSYYQKTITVDGEEILLSILDTAGEERFRTNDSCTYFSAKVS